MNHEPTDSADTTEHPGAAGEPNTYDEADALVVVDFQNDFADREGSLSVAGADQIIPALNVEISEAAAAGATVVYTQDWHPESTPHFQRDGGVWPVHCVGGTWGAELHPALTVVDGAVFVKKGSGGQDGYSGFSMRSPGGGETESTGLAETLRGRGVSRVSVAGLATDYCVKETALDAVRLGFDAVALTGLMRAVDLEPGDGDRAIEAMRRAGVEIR